MSEFQSAPQFVRIDPLTDDRWDAFLQAQPDARIWHSSAWLGTLQRAFDYTGAHLACVVDGTLTGVLPLLLVESRVTGRRLSAVFWSFWPDSHFANRPRGPGAARFRAHRRALLSLHGHPYL